MWYIEHHGIKGQKWGVRNGPPYPLSEGAHSSSEKKQSSNKSVKSSKEGLDPMTAYLAMIGIVTAANLTTAAVSSGKKHLDAALANKRGDKIDQRIAQNKNVDKASGLKLKDREYTEKEDLKQVNPRFKNFDTDTKNNCQMCSITYELRRRGYDVTANKVSTGRHMGQIMEVFPKAKTKFMGGDPPYDFKTNKVNLTNDDHYNKYMNDQRKAIRGANFDNAKTFMETLKKEDNSSGLVGVYWGVGGGHSMHYTVKNGEVEIQDAQVGKTFKGSSAIKMLSNGFYFRYTPLDNIDFDKKKVKEVCH